MTIHEAIAHAGRVLREGHIPDPEQDAVLIMSYLTGLSPMEARLRSTMPLTSQQEQRLSSLLLSRVQRIPLQYLLEEQWFYGRRFYVDERVLIPRQETENLCELGIKHLRGLASPTALDLCTGSGAIAATLKLECPHAQVVATDLSEDALKVAQHNARELAADIRFVRGDLFAPLKGMRFDLILTNPPYIESAACISLQPEVLREPIAALDGGEDGLDFYRRIADEAHAYLVPGGLLAAEVGDDQAEKVATLFDSRYLTPQIHLDLYGHRRIVSVHAAATPT